MNDSWILFSYSIPATNAKARMRIWRRLTAIGAVQLKTGILILPNREDLLENIIWLVGEVNSLGGEAIAIQCIKIEGISERQIKQLFQAQIDPEFTKIQDEARSLLTTEGTATDRGEDNTPGSTLRKLRKRCEAARSRDFFPSGAATVTMKVLDSVAERVHRPDRDSIQTHQRDRSQFQGRTWVTRSRPYIDRLGSAWLIRRFIDEQARFRFLCSGEAVNFDQGELPFDMTVGEFTHRGELITFEVLIRDFSLDEPALNKMGELVKCIDIQDGVLPDDAILLKNLMDGLIALTTDDNQLLERSAQLFDALYAGYAKSIPGNRQAISTANIR